MSTSDLDQIKQKQKGENRNVEPLTHEASRDMHRQELIPTLPVLELVRGGTSKKNPRLLLCKLFGLVISAPKYSY